jgi:hypothetical protein
VITPSQTPISRSLNELAYAHKDTTDETAADKAANDETAVDAYIAVEIADKTAADETGAAASFNTANGLASDVIGRRKRRRRARPRPHQFCTRIVFHRRPLAPVNP